MKCLQRRVANATSTALVPTPAAWGDALRALGAAGVLLVLLAACAAPGPAPTDADEAAIGLQRFTVDGKVSWRGPGGSGRAAIVWAQDPEQARLLVTGPFGSGAAVLDSVPGRATLRVGDSVRFADSAEALLRRELDLPLPVDQARWWVLGVAAPGPVAERERDPGGRLQRLRQAGWEVRIERWTAVDGLALPGRLIMTRDELRLLFVATRWQPGVALWPGGATPASAGADH